MFFFLLRALLFILVIILLSELPLLQILLLFFINLSMVVYNLAIKPLINKLDFYEICVYEIILLIANVIMLLIYASADPEVKSNLGIAMISTFILFAVCALIFLFLNLVEGIIRSLRLIKKAKKEHGAITCI